MKILCPHCKHEIPAQQINVTADFGICAQCNSSFKPSEMTSVSDSFGKNMLNPPQGCWYRREAGRHVVGATTRSPLAFFLVPFMIVWSGGALGGIYGRQIANGQFELLPSLFGIPFLLGSIVFWAAALMALFGQVEVTINGKDASVFIGIGKIGWTRHFSWSLITSIREVESSHRNGSSTSIVLEGPSRIRIGGGITLSENRRYFLLNALRTIKAQQG